MPDLQIHTPDGKSRKVSLTGERLYLGRSTTADLCFPDDNGLSRQHLTFEREGSEWLVKDLGSKNGTMLNGSRIRQSATLRPGDRVSAGHLVMVFTDKSESATRPGHPVFFVDHESGDEITASTVISSLEGVLQREPTAAESADQAQLRALLRAGNELASERPLPELFQYILDLALQAVSADRGLLLTLENDVLVVKAARGDGFRISAVVRDRVLKTGSSVLVRDAQMDEAFKERKSIVEQNVRTLMAAPLQTRDRIIGLIYVDSPAMMREFTKSELDLLTVMANVAANRIESVRLALVERTEKLLARELEQAAEIQRRFLPEEAPKVAGLDMHGFNIPCRTVGGDYFDFFDYGNRKVAMVLGDVSGKGMPASLLMMGLQARVQVLIDEPDNLAQTMTRLNRITCANCPDNKFITLFMAVLDAEAGKLTYSSAGHNPAILVRADGTYELLSGGGPVLGILRSLEFAHFEVTVGPGDMLVVYSDGVTEAASPEDEEFETERLAEVVTRHRDKTAREIIDAVNVAVREWTRGAPAADDVTLIVARILADKPVVNGAGGSAEPVTSEDLQTSGKEITTDVY